MASRKYTTRKKNDANKEINGILGLVLVIVSVFFLICLIITPILSAIGYAVRSLLLGTLGYFSYPFFVCMLVVGISLLRSMKLRIQSKTLLLICAMILTLVFLLQTVASGGISGSIDQYVSAVWSTKNTAGGLVFGIPAFGLQKLLSKTGAIIFYVVLLVIFAALLVYKAVVASGLVENKKQEPVRKFVHGEAPPAMVKTVRNTDLYVDTILPRNNPETSGMVSEEGVASRIRPEEKSAVDKYNDKSIEFDKNDEQSAKQNARKILFGDKDRRSLDVSSPFASSYGDSRTSYGDSRTSYGGSGTSSYGKTLFGGSRYNRTSAGYEEQMQSLRKLSENTIPDENEIKKSTPITSPKSEVKSETLIPEKDISSEYVGGVIINGDEVAARHQMHDKPEDNEKNKKEENTRYDYRYTQKSDDGRPPIVNGDYFGIDDGVHNRNNFDFNESSWVRDDSEVRNDEVRNDTNTSGYRSIYDVLNQSQQEKFKNEIKSDVDEQTVTSDSRDQNDADDGDNDISQKNVNREDRQKIAEESINRLIDAEKNMRNMLNIDESDKSDDAEDETQKDSDIVNFGDFDRPINPTVTEFKPEVKNREVSKEEQVYMSFEDDDSDKLSSEGKSDKTLSNDGGIINGDNVDPTKGFNFIDNAEDLSENDAPVDINSGYYEKVESDKTYDADNITDVTEDNGELDDVASVEDDTNASNTSENEQSDERFALMQSYVSALKPKKDKVSENQMNIDEYMENKSSEFNVVYSIKNRYSAPPLDLLRQESTEYSKLGGDTEKNSQLLEKLLEDFKFPAKVVTVVPGPAVTRYELEIPRGVPIKKIEERAPDIAYELESKGKIRIETPIPGKKAVGVEVPNKEVGIVGLKDIIGSKEFKNASSPLTIAIGKDIAGEIVLCNLEKIVHLLIAGSTGSGKSSCLNCIVTSIIYKSSPEDVRLILIDPKQVEFTIYSGIPHLLINDIIKDTEQALNALKWAVNEMDTRYKLFGSKQGCRNIREYNALEEVRTGKAKKLPFIVIIIDEFSALMGGKNKDIEDNIISIAQKSRAAGIHLILATQRPSVDVLTGLIKTNLPSRIAFAVTSGIDSRTILDKTGAETLIGRGDMLYAPQEYNEPKRVQGAFIDTPEIADIVNYVKTYNKSVFYEDAEQIIKKKAEEKSVDIKDDPNADAMDPLLPGVLKYIIDTNQVSATMIQRRFAVGYARAARILDQMEMHQFVSPSENKKPREIYITKEMYEKLFGNQT